MRGRAKQRGPPVAGRRSSAGWDATGPSLVLLGRGAGRELARADADLVALGDDERAHRVAPLRTVAQADRRRDPLVVPGHLDEVAVEQHAGGADLVAAVQADGDRAL